MKAWVLFTRAGITHVEETDAVGVFTTKEKARSKLKEMQKKSSWTWGWIKSFEVDE